MGYYVNIENVEWLLPVVHEDAALQVLKDLNDPSNDHLKRGGSYSGGKQTAKWFSWMPKDYDKTVTTVYEVLDMLGFETEVLPEGTRIRAYDSKTGQEDLFLAAIAEFIEPGSFIEWRGEDGAFWRNDFDGKTMRTLEGSISYSEVSR
jgi:hypothetical protein